MSALTHAGRPFRAPTRSTEPTTGARLGDLVWLTWRQHRWALTGSLAIAAVLTGWMAYLSAHIASINQQCGYTVCSGDSPQYPDLHGDFGPLQVSGLLTNLVVFLPLLVGMFLGVPLLAREHEQRTLLLAWSQDITPARWLWTKFTLLGGVTAALMACVSASCGHLANVVNVATAGSLFTGNAFWVTGMVPLALGVAWFVVGVAVGAAVRRVLPSVLAAIAGFIGLYLLAEWRYPAFLTPLTASVPVSLQGPSADAGPNALLISGVRVAPNGTSLIDASGQAVSPAGLQAMCPPSPSGTAPGAAHSSLWACVAQHHLNSLMVYQPGSRIAVFHLILIGGYLGIGVVALAATWWLVRRTSLSAG